MSKPYTAEQFLQSVELSGCSFSHDDATVLFTSNQTGVFGAYVLPVSGGTPRQLTQSSTVNTQAVSFFPHDGRVVLTRDQDGDENSHLLILEDDGQEVDLTPNPAVRAQFLCWSHDGKAFYFESNERDARFFDVYRVSVSDYERSLVYQNDVGYQFSKLSNDENFIAFVRINTLADSDLYLLSRATKEMRHLTSHVSNVYFSCPCFDPEARYLYYLTDEDTEYSHVVRMKLATGQVEWLKEYPVNLWYMYLSQSGKYLVLGIHEDDSTKIQLYDLTIGTALMLPSVLAGNVAAAKISRSERYMGVYLDNDCSGKELFIYDFVSKTTQRLLGSLAEEIDPTHLVQSKSISYNSFDGLEIHSILWTPHAVGRNFQLPALIWIHGGPGGQAKKGYDGLIQFIVNSGYVVLAVNHRGSVGYGKTFLAADDRKHGREPLWDCVEAKKFLGSLGFVDVSRIGVIGSSYGGYMVLAALAFQPDQFAAGIDMFGVSNWVRALETLPPYWDSYQRGFLYEKIGDPRSDREELEAISPLFHADKITKPLLVLQGANDVRVRKSESDDIVEAVRGKGGIVDYILFEDEGHGLSKKANKVRAYHAILNFLDLHLHGPRFV